VGARPVAGHVEAPGANSAGSFDDTPSKKNRLEPVFLIVRLLRTVSPTGELPNDRDVGREMVVGVAVAVGVPV
jgi:hypothetical protein